MVGCEISGGLGNQFFRYVAARAILQKRKAQGHDEKMLINARHLDAHGVSGNLFDFCIYEHEKSFVRRQEMAYGSILQKIMFLAYTFITRTMGRVAPPILWKIDGGLRRVMARWGMVISKDPDNEPLLFPSSWYKNCFTYGSFERYGYIDGIESILKRELTPVHPCRKENERLYEVIRSTNSVCLAVRRGDFMTAENRKVFYVCDVEYFRRAVDYMQKHVENPVFIVFSNDIAWVKENIRIEGTVYYESGNDPVWETFRLMYSCKHFVISNSTLHWWAQWRSENESKIVVAPDHWYNWKGAEQHLMLPSFVRMPTGVPYGQ